MNIHDTANVFAKEILAWIQEKESTNNDFDVIKKKYSLIINFKKRNFIINLIYFPSSEGEEGNTLCELDQSRYDYGKVLLINVWEDLWHEKKDIVESRLQALLGHSIRIYARNTVCKPVSLDVLMHFLRDNHLQSYAKSKYGYGLFYEDRLVAVASFGAARIIKQGNKIFLFHDLIRFSGILFHTITGGISKLLKNFIKDIKPDAVVTYADKDWSAGYSYMKTGFKKISETYPIVFWVHPKEFIRYTYKSLPDDIKKLFNKFGYKYESFEDFMHSMGYLRVQNSGNLKYLLPLSHEL